jgi:Zn-finger nucleic acid-binding protein
MKSEKNSESMCMKCLRCDDQELQEVTFSELNGATIHMCSQCEGAWYPKHSLQSITRHDKDQLEESDLAPVLEGDKLDLVDLDKPVFCPVCQEEMDRFSYPLAPEVELDQCSAHGMWLDDGELGTILDQLVHRRESMDDYRQKIKQKRQEMDIDGIAMGGKYNPFALTLRVLNKVFTMGKG